MLPRIYQEVEVRDTVIQNVLSNSVPPPLHMMEDDVSGSILKSDVQKEEDAAPPVALWGSWFYSSWKSDMDMVHPLEENWKSLLCIFCNFILRWSKLWQLRSWIAFDKRYQSS